MAPGLFLSACEHKSHYLPRQGPGASASASVAEGEQLGGLLIVWEPARCPEMMEFGNGSSVLQIRAQKCAGKVVGKTPRNDSPAAVFLKEEFVLQPDSNSVYVWISQCALKLYFPIEGLS